MAAVEESVIAHGYAVYSQHLTTKPNLVNYSEDQERTSDFEGNEDEGFNESSISYRFSLLSSNINVERETLLRAFITKRMEQMQPLKDTGITLSIPAGEVYDANSMVYFYSMPQEYDDCKENMEYEKDAKGWNKSFLICFLAVVETGLDLFQPELDNYCKLLGPYIHKYLESVDVSEYLKRLESWFEINISYIERSLFILDKQLSSFLFSIFLGQDIKMEGLDQKTKDDLEKFIACCSLEGLLHEKKDKDQKLSHGTISEQDSNTQVIIKPQDRFLDISSSNTNGFCHNCMKSLNKISQNHPVKLRQVIETYKLKLIQDMNTLKRLLKQAETDYYALYRSYVFLLSSENGEVLLSNAKVQCDGEEDQSCEQVLKVIEQFIDDKMGFDVVVIEKSRKKAQYLLNQLDC